MDRCFHVAVLGETCLDRSLRTSAVAIPSDSRATVSSEAGQDLSPRTLGVVTLEKSPQTNSVIDSGRSIRERGVAAEVVPHASVSVGVVLDRSRYVCQNAPQVTAQEIAPVVVDRARPSEARGVRVGVTLRGTGFGGSDSG